MDFERCCRSPHERRTERVNTMDDQPQHSIARHPLRELLTVEEWQQLREDVQFCRVSWPISWIIEREEENQEDAP